MSSQMIKELIDAGIHFGHRASRWNPKMKPYIYGKRNSLHIIDVRETFRGLLLAKKFIIQTVAKGKDVMFVGTKRQARKSVQTNADRIGMHWVNERWVGGTLTNFHEIRKRVGRLEELEQMEADGMLDAYSKKEGSRMRREMRKIQRNLGGIRKMTKFPGVMVVVDATREIIAIREARKAGMPVICLIDTDADPDVVDIPIPGNDDAMRAIEIVMRELADAAEIGTHTRMEGADSDGTEKSQRRSKRETTARADDDTEAPVAVEAAESVQAPVTEEAPVAPLGKGPVVAPAGLPEDTPTEPPTEAPPAE